jgi:hypothetical protein
MATVDRVLRDLAFPEVLRHDVGDPSSTGTAGLFNVRGKC